VKGYLLATKLGNSRVSIESEIISKAMITIILGHFKAEKCEPLAEEFSVLQSQSISVNDRIIWRPFTKSAITSVQGAAPIVMHVAERISHVVQ
jgi:hypothetical protein